MPTISMFFGIVMRMFPATREHPPAHLHASYGDFSATFDRLTAERIAGDLLVRQCRLVAAWIELHREELAADWKLAQSGELPFRIDPLR